MKHYSRIQTSASSQPNRRGSTLLVVLALLGLLALLGFTFYTFAAQERAAAEYFASEAHVTGTTAQPEGIFEWPLRQILLGPDELNYNSVLWGGRFSLVPGLLGLDGIPFNGEGINLGVDASGNAFVDMNFDGAQDNPTFLSGPVDSPAANNGTFWGTGKSKATLPGPDVDYTSPDINNMLLSYDAMAINTSNATSRVFIPSLLRPQYLRNGGSTITDWYNNPTLVPAAASFRPHPNHVYIDSSGNSTNMTRYVQTQSDANNLGLTSPFTFQPLDPSGTATNGAIGVWTNPSTPLTMNLDVDTDGDGIRESILVDLGYPPFRRGDGKMVVPLFAIQIRDLNGLININTSTSRLTKNLVPPDLTTQEFGADSNGNPRYLSSSNQGHSTSEINPSYGLSTDPTTVSSSDLQQYHFFLKMLGANRNPFSMREVANIEWFFLTYGRPQFNVQAAQNATASAAAMAATIETITPGRLGEVENMLSVLANGTGTLPQAGLTNFNDNYDTTNPSYPFLWTTATANPQLGTPFDLIGNGSLLLPNTSNQNPYGKKLNVIDRSTQPAIGPNRWLSFQGYHSAGDVYLSNSTYANLLFPPTTITNQLTDDSAEVITDPDALNLASSSYSPPIVGGAQGARTSTGLSIDNDAVFGSLETAFLQQSNGDGTLVRGTSRIANLIPVNSTAGSTSADIRSQYTTVSSDRREFNKATTTQTTNQLRPWESNYLASSLAATSPLRPLLWYHLSGYSTLNSKSMRLSANQLLVDSNGEAFPSTTPTGLMFRDLTAHPSQTNGLPSAAIPTGPLTYPNGGSFPSMAQQEYFARRDRQAMARDIYVLLYLYGAGLDVDPATTSNSPPGTVYTTAQMKEMAQFAVNYVDALDRDSIMTRFEYDTDLSDGWGLDDNPYTTTEGGRKEVWGVENQQLTFAEALVVKTNKLTSNNSTTEWDDTTARFFTYVDLQSTSPYPIDFSANMPWQVRVLTSGTSTTQSDERRLTPKTGTIPAGGLFTILTSGDSSTNDSAGNPTSNFKVNSNQIIPSTTLAAQNRLDLIVDPLANFDLTDGVLPTPAQKTGRGDFLGPNNSPDISTVKLPVIFQLMRRADPYRSTPTTSAEDADNPWIEVDRIQLGNLTTSGYKLFDIQNTTDAAGADTLLEKLTSRFRYEPFAADFEQDYTKGSTQTNKVYNYIGNQKKYDPAGNAPSVLYSQFHFDRPFASLGELLDIPVVGPGLYSNSDLWYDSSETLYLTKALGHANQSPFNQVNVNLAGATPPNRAMTAAAKFLLADFPDTIDPNAQLNNRWYRLLEFLEVPSPMHRSPELHTYSTQTLGLPINFGWVRNHGQLNLNMIRHPNVLAGLLDDNAALNVQPVGLSSGLGGSIPTRDPSDTTTYGTRDFWYEFLRARDGIVNPLANPGNPNLPTADSVTGLYIPGVPGTRPFRSFSFTSRGALSQKQDTLFRTLPADASATNNDPRSLFEIGQAAEHTGAGAAGPLDSISKNRLLSKIMNNVTTRSNSFGVFIAVQYFEAAEDKSGGGSPAIRIGGRLDDSPTQRAFFVIDRTGAVEQWKNLKSQGITPVYPNTFSIVPDTSTNGTPNGINWQQLVLYRQTLN